MKFLFIFFLLLISFITRGSCLNLNGEWEGVCNRDGRLKVESILISQNSCNHINFYGIDYQIGRPYESRGENRYQYLVNIYNFYWVKNMPFLIFNVDRIRWMKYKNVVSTGEGRGVIKVQGDKMSYSRTYSSRKRHGVYLVTHRKCDFTRKI